MGESKAEPLLGVHDVVCGIIIGVQLSRKDNTAA